MPKKMSVVTRLENNWLTLENAASFVHLLAFSDGKIQGFLFVFQPVNLSFRFIIRHFSITVNNRKTSRFLGVHCLVITVKTDCFPLFYWHFPVAKQLVNWIFSHCPGVHRAVNTLKTDCFKQHGVNSCLMEFSFIVLVFTARLTHAKQVGVFRLQNNAFTGVLSEFCIFLNSEFAGCAFFPALSAFGASPFWWYFTCTLKSVGSHILQIWLYLRFHLL